MFIFQAHHWHGTQAVICCALPELTGLVSTKCKQLAIREHR
jgi:hypothetical protein